MAADGGRERSPSPPTRSSPSKRRRSTDFDTSSPKRPKHHDHRHRGDTEDVDADSADPGSDYRKARFGRHAIRTRENARERQDSRERYRHRGGSSSRIRSSDRWESAPIHEDFETIGGDKNKDRYHRSSSNRDRRKDPTFSASDGYKQGPRSCDKVTDIGHQDQGCGERKDNSYKDEGKTKHHENSEPLLSVQKFEKGRKISIVLKFRQHEVESVPSVDTEEVRVMDRHKRASLKDNSYMANIQAKNKHDSSHVPLNKEQFTVDKPPACSDGGPPAATQKSSKVGGGSHIQRNDHPDNWDDVEGYYSYRCGELLNGRYEIASAHGKGVFSTVVRAKDLQAGKDDPGQVAIKIVRNNDTMNRAGKDEVSILGKLAGADNKDKYHCVRFISSFRYHNHLCLVFESLDMNLRQALKKFTSNTGFDLTTVRGSSKQLFTALKHLKNCKVLHCDIKPENILVDDTKKLLKLCDFGSAMLAGMNEVTPYLVSRFYRAPEIILGLPYDHPLDIWSVGCCLYELYTGKVLFPGESNNDMLRRHMELKGAFPKKMLRKGAFTTQHFNRDLNFQAVEEDPVTKKVSSRLILNSQPKGVGSKISNIRSVDPKLLSSFKDLLDKMFVLDPEKRITVEQALRHPFITGKLN